jgi:hypothetical protein
MYSYVFCCWMLANLTHPVFFLLLSLFSGDSVVARDLTFWTVMFIPMVLLSLFITIPSVLLGWFVLGIIMKIPGEVLYKFCIWLLSTIPIIFINLIILNMLLYEEISIRKIFQFNGEVLLFILPAIVAVISSSFICYKQFTRIFNQQDHETNLV